MSDAVFLIAFIGLSCFAGAGFSILIRRRNPEWSRRKGIAIAALPVPAVLAGFSLWVLARALWAVLAGNASCAGGACSMAATFATIGLFWAVVAFGLAALAAAYTGYRGVS